MSNRYKIVIQYDGSNFLGFQSQKDPNTIQSNIDKSLSFLNNNKEIKIVGASRTDSGVHALGQVAHFDLNTNLDDKSIKRYKLYLLKMFLKIFILDIMQIKKNIFISAL